MLTIKELKEQYQELKMARDSMIKGQDIWSDDWSPDKIILEGETDPNAKAQAYIKKCQELKSVEDELIQAEELRKLASVGMKDRPADSEYRHESALKAHTTGIKDWNQFREAVGHIQHGYKEYGQKHHELKFSPEFLKAVVVGGTQARMPGQEVDLPAWPRTDILDIATWYSIDSNIYIKYEIARSTTTLPLPRAEAGDIKENTPTVPQRSFIMHSIGSFIDVAQESMDDISQLQMNIRELISREMRHVIANQAAAGVNTGQNWNGMEKQITNVDTIGTNTDILTDLRGKLIGAVAAGNPYTHFLVDAATIEKFTESLDRRGFAQYDRGAYPMGIFMGCVGVPTTQFTANFGHLIASDHWKLLHKGDISVMMSDDVEFKANVVTIRALIRGNVCYSYPASEGLQLKTINNYQIQSSPQG